MLGSFSGVYFALTHIFTIWYEHSHVLLILAIMSFGFIAILLHYLDFQYFDIARTR
jgi:hypothetical protein